MPGLRGTPAVTITTLAVGTNNQLVSLDPVAAESFAPTSVDSNVEMAATTTAVDITIGYAISAAPGVGDSVSVGTTLFGEAVG